VINACRFFHIVGLDPLLSIAHDLCRSLVSVEHVQMCPVFLFLISVHVRFPTVLKVKMYDNLYQRLGRGRDGITDTTHKKHVVVFMA
jgi:hypothetical protein